MRMFRLLLGTLLGAVLTFTGTARPAAAEPLLLNPKLSGAHQVSGSGPFKLSPDGSRVVYAREIGGQPWVLFSAPTDGSAPPVVLTPPSIVSTVGAFAISPDGNRVVYLFDNALASDQLELYSAPLGGGAPVKLSGPLPASATIEDFVISPDSARVVYRADVYADGEFELFTVPIAGGALLRLNKAPVAGGGVTADYTFSPDSSRIVYVAELDSATRPELYASRLDRSGSQRLNDELTGLANVENFMTTPDNMVLYIADTGFMGKDELYSVPLFNPQLTAGSEATALSGGVIKLNGELVAGGLGVTEYRYIPGTRQVVYRADAEQPVRHNLYSVKVTGGPVSQVNEELVALGGVDRDFVISPDGQWVIYRADQQVDTVEELFAVPLAGGASLRLNRDLVDEGDVKEFAVSADSRRVVYLANQDSSDIDELYSTALPTAPGSPGPAMLAGTKLNLPFEVSGEVRSFAISPAGDRVVYRAAHDTVNVDELYNVPIGGGAVAKLNGVPVAGGDVLEFQFTADGSRVVYRADQEADGIHALYAAYEPTPSATITGPAGSLPVGEHTVKVILSQPMQLANVQVRVDATGGDAVPGTDYLLPGTSTPQLAGAPDVVFVVFAPGEKSKTIPVKVLTNAERTSSRTLRLAIPATAAVTPGSPGSVDLTLAQHVAIINPPSPSPSTPPTGYRTMLPLAQR